MIAQCVLKMAQQFYITECTPILWLDHQIGTHSGETILTFDPNSYGYQPDESDHIAAPIANNGDDGLSGRVLVISPEKVLPSRQNIMWAVFRRVDRKDLTDVMIVTPGQVGCKLRRCHKLVSWASFRDEV